MAIQTQLRITQVLLVLCLGLNLWCVMSALNARELESTESPEIRIRKAIFESIVIARRDGKTLMELGIDEEPHGGPVIRLYNSDSVPVVRLDTSNLSFAHGKTRVAAFGKTDSGGYLKLSDEDGNVALEFLPDQEGLGTAFFFQDGEIKFRVPNKSTDRL